MRINTEFRPVFRCLDRLKDRNLQNLHTMKMRMSSSTFHGLRSFALGMFVLIISVARADVINRDDLHVPCPYLDSINITSGHMDESGNILFNGTQFPPDYYASYNYQFVSTTKRVWVPYHTRGCVCKLKNCIRMCCDPHWYFINGTCVPFEGGLLNYEMAVQDLSTGENETVNVLTYFGVVYGKPCQAMYALNPAAFEDERYILQSDGLLKFPGRPAKDGTNSFCITHERTDSDEVTPVVYTCFEDESEIKFAVYPFGMLISVPFLVITFVVYLVIPELQNLHGRNLMCYVFGLTMSYILMSCIHWFTDKVNVVSPKFCAGLGFATYFGFMASFFWLNVMCFDIWWTFRGVHGVIKDAERRKFLLYSCYAWGSSIAILGWCILTDFTDLLPIEYRPGFGTTSCWLKRDRITEFMYLYSIVIILIFVNITLFACTSYKIRKLQQETAAITKGESRKFNKMDADKDRFGLYLRLFIVMGVSWSTEILSWAVEDHQWIFYVTDFFNCLQGLFIFGLFVWKPKIKALIIKRYRTKRGDRPFRSSSHTNSTQMYSRQSRTASSAINNNNNSCIEKSLMATDCSRD